MDLRILGVAGGVGTLGAGGIYLVVANPFKTEEKTIAISELIKNEEFMKPLTKNSSDDAKGNAAGVKYRDAHKTTPTGSTYREKDIGGLSNGSQQKGQDNAFDEFKNKCEEKSKAKVSPSSQEYKDFKNYCARPKTVAELIGEDTKTILLSKTDSGDSNHGNKAWEEYRKAHLQDNSSNTYKTEDTGKVIGWNSSGGDSSATSYYKDKCESQANLDINIARGLKDENFVNVKNGCTKRSS